MAKIRVYQLAKELGVASKDLLIRLHELGYTHLKTASSGLTEEEVEKIKAIFFGEEEEKEEEVKVEEEKVEEKEVKEERKEEKEEIKRPVIEIDETVTVRELAEKLNVKASELIKYLLSQGIVATLNQRLDIDTATLVAHEMGYEVKLKQIFEEIEEKIKPENLVPRPPIVTVMGHVDHGKTTLLDTIRETNVAEKEAGAMTQHIGAYQIEFRGHKITFIDTPGHELFTAMRARGAQVTDIVVLVVAADDGVMPQTVEAINHARAANVPIIVAINKIDLPQANVSRVKQQLSEYNLIPEEWGGDTIFVEISAKKNIGIDELLELIILKAETMELKADPNIPASGVVIESKLDPRKGALGTVLVKQGRLKIGDAFVSGITGGKVRNMFDEWGKRVEVANPSQPVEILGFISPPQLGDTFYVVEDERKMRKIVEIRREEFERKKREGIKRISLESIYKEGVKILPLVIKADVLGSLEAIKDGIERIEHPEISLKIIHQGVGPITESDVILASASNAIIIGYNVRPDEKASKLSKEEGVEIRLYNIIFHLVEDVKKALEGLLTPIKREEVLGKAIVKKVFRISKIGNVAGCEVKEGKVVKGVNARIIRDGIVVGDAKISSLKRFKSDVEEVETGFECGIGFENFKDVKEGDLIEAYKVTEEKKRLE
ncbi:MAG: translation initiation factor IF-2 [Caldiserica bacterium]|nr:MAG: translation initiation factor IF-2 [Caldisericota bacterium]